MNKHIKHANNNFGPTYRPWLHEPWTVDRMNWKTFVPKPLQKIIIKNNTIYTKLCFSVDRGPNWIIKVA